MKRTTLALVFSFAANAAIASDIREVSWPFPRDAWPIGKALTCQGEGCSGKELITVRAKFGFCNCEAGVRDDDEVDYAADIDMIGQNFKPAGAGTPVELFGLKGRARLYQYPLPGRASQMAIGIALARKCDLLAISISALDTPESALAVQRFVSQSTVIRDIVARALGEAPNPRR